jgi:hypothetical protein
VCIIYIYICKYFVEHSLWGRGGGGVGVGAGGWGRGVGPGGGGGGGWGMGAEGGRPTKQIN